MTATEGPGLRDDDLRRYLELRADTVAATAASAEDVAIAMAEELGFLTRPRRGWPRVLRVAIVITLLVVLLAATFFLAGRQRDPYTPDLPQVTSTLHGSPWAVTTAAGSVWIGAYQEPVVFQIDPSTGAVLAEVAVGRRVCGQLEAGLGYVWFSDCGGYWLSRLDPLTLTVDRLAGYGQDRVTFGDGSVWVPHDGAVERLDPVTLETLVRIPVEGGGLLAFGSGSLWLSDADGGNVVRIDPTTERVTATIDWPVTSGRAYPVHLVAADDAIWVVDEDQLRIYRIDPATNQAAPLPLELEPIDGTGFGDHPIVAAVGELWVRESEGSLARIDTRTLEVVERQSTDAVGGGAFAVTEGALWVANLKGDTVTGVRRP